jgi:hypothetical protein
MKKHLLILVALLLLVSLTQATDPADEDLPERGLAGCPAHRAAELGHNPFEAFHKIMAPVWHGAWPDKDYDSLLAAGPTFKEAFAAIAKMKPTFKTLDRKKAFLKARDGFSKIIEMYAAAAERGDKETVYDLMPQLHDAFEMTASTLLPVYYPEIEAAVITLNLIMETHLPKNNMEGILGSTNTLLSRFESLTDTTTIPDELQEKKKEIRTEIAAMKKLAQQMKECCDKNDMEHYKEHVRELDTKLKSFFEKYI